MPNYFPHIQSNRKGLFPKGGFVQSRFEGIRMGGCDACIIFLLQLKVFSIALSTFHCFRAWTVEVCILYYLAMPVAHNSHAPSLLLIAFYFAIQSIVWYVEADVLPSPPPPVPGSEVVSHTWCTNVGKWLQLYSFNHHFDTKRANEERNDLCLLNNSCLHDIMWIIVFAKMTTGIWCSRIGENYWFGVYMHHRYGSDISFVSLHSLQQWKTHS